MVTKHVNWEINNKYKHLQKAAASVLMAFFFSM